VELFGAKSAQTDAEAILLADMLLRKLGLKVKLFINSIGCPTCRAAYNKALKEFFAPHLESLCFDCKTRFEKNPLRLLDCKEEECKKINANAPKILDYICDDCSNHFEKVKELLTLAGVEYKINPNIVRGLDYYTRTVFEFVSENIGAQGTVCGGGRYDGLVSQLGGNDTPGIGFAMGIERILMLLENTGVQIPNANKVKVYLAPMGEKEAEKVFELSTILRANAIACDFDHMGRGIKSQFKYADKIGAEFVGVIGSNELEQGIVKLKKMADGSEYMVNFTDLVTFFKG
jgi:histidyl-tRNA synthetase